MAQEISLDIMDIGIDDYRRENTFVFEDESISKELKRGPNVIPFDQILNESIAFDDILPENFGNDENNISSCTTPTLQEDPSFLGDSPDTFDVLELHNLSSAIPTFPTTLTIDETELARIGLVLSQLEGQSSTTPSITDTTDISCLSEKEIFLMGDCDMATEHEVKNNPQTMGSDLPSASASSSTSTKRSRNKKKKLWQCDEDDNNPLNEKIKRAKVAKDNRERKNQTFKSLKEDIEAEKREKLQYFEELEASKQSVSQRDDQIAALKLQNLELQTQLEEEVIKNKSMHAENESFKKLLIKEQDSKTVERERVLPLISLIKRHVKELPNLKIEISKRMAEKPIPEISEEEMAEFETQNAKENSLNITYTLKLGDDTGLL